MLRKNVNVKKKLQDIRINQSFGYENTFTEGTNLRPIKAMRRNERFLSLALKWILLEKHVRRAFNWTKYTHE